MVGLLPPAPPVPSFSPSDQQTSISHITETVPTLRQMQQQQSSTLFRQRAYTAMVDLKWIIEKEMIII